MVGMISRAWPARVSRSCPLTDTTSKLRRHWIRNSRNAATPNRAAASLAKSRTRYALSLVIPSSPVIRALPALSAPYHGPGAVAGDLAGVLQPWQASHVPCACRTRESVGGVAGLTRRAKPPTVPLPLDSVAAGLRLLGSHHWKVPASMPLDL